MDTAQIKQAPKTNIKPYNLQGEIVPRNRGDSIDIVEIYAPYPLDPGVLRDIAESAAEFLRVQG